MNAIVTAGGKPRPDEPLYQNTQGINKAMLDIAGKPMIQWVLDALGASAGIERIIIIGLPEPSGLTCAKPLVFLEDHGGILSNLEAGAKEIMRLSPHHQKVLAVSSDIPGIKSEMIDWLIQKIQPTDLDLYYNVIPQAVMEKRYPNSRRTYTKLKDIVATGGDVNAINTRIFSAEKPLWGQIIQSRKNPIKQASLIGFDTLFLVLTRQITLEKAVGMITRRLGVTGQAIICPYAEMGMDVDKPHQLEMMRRGHEPSESMNRSSLLELDWRWSARLRLRQEKGLIRGVAVFLAHSGDSWFWVVGLGLVWLLSRGPWRYTAAIMVLAIVLLAGIVLAIKLLVRRRRPEGEWGAVYRSVDPHSFPSGHAARAIMLAVLACGLGPTWFAVLLVIWAPCVSLARVLMGVHYLMDIIAGIAIGLVVGLAVLAAQPMLATLLPFFFDSWR